MHSQRSRGSRSCGESSLVAGSAWQEQLPRSLEGFALCGTVLLRSSSRTGRGERSCGWSAAMHRLRTTVTRLRPLTAAQTAQSLSQPRLSASDRGLRTFQPVRRQNTSVAAEPFLNGTSSNYVEEMYYAWLENPRNVHKVLNVCVCVCVCDVTPVFCVLGTLNSSIHMQNRFSATQMFWGAWRDKNEFSVVTDTSQSSR